MKNLTLILLIFALNLILSCEKPSNFSINSKAYNFVLVDNGSLVSLKDFEKRYKVILLYFGYTHCPDVCPTVLHKLSKAYDELGPYKKYVKVMFITLDPDRDTPAVADQYAKFFNPAFSGLSGSKKDIEEVAKKYNVIYKIVPSKSQGYLIDHSDNIYLIYHNKLNAIFTNESQNPNNIAKYIIDLLDKH